MDKRKSIKIGIAVFVVVGTLLAIPVQQPVQAGGFEDGQSEAEQDFNRSNGQGKDPGCSPENGVDYCTAYKAGYESRWAHMWAIFDCSSGQCQ
jgi:hypothetical protein